MIETGRFLQQRYRIDKQIGQGGMGAVYVATDERFGSTVAIKETLCMDDNFRKAIEREARLLNSLKHAALPRVSDHFEEDNGQFLVMEYIPGDDVGSMLDPDSNKFTTEQVLKWADQLLDALDYLHNQVMPVIHRDIKPQNLKITPRGDMILLDFGLAKGNPTDAGNNTAAKSIFGYSRNYASLEQIQGTGTDPRSDLYSLAATLYHLLTNVGPEDALTRAMAVLSQKHDPLVPANVLNPSVPRGVAGVLHNALALNADERPLSAADMRQMLRESENYGYLADAVTIAALATPTSVFAQQTKLMPDATNVGNMQTEAKTEVLTDYSSDRTSIRPAEGSVAHTNVGASDRTLVAKQKGRGVGVATGALGTLLVVGAVACTLYMVKPSLFGVGQEAPQQVDAVTTLPVAVDTNTAANANVDSAGQAASLATNTAIGTTSSKSETRSPATPKTGETAKTAKEDPGDVLIQDDDGSTVRYSADGKNMTVTERHSDGTSTTTVIRNPPKMPNIFRPPNQPNPFAPDFDSSNLTPEQKRRMKTIIRNNIRRSQPTNQPANRPPE
jgi:serine/threonine protein kinase